MSLYRRPEWLKFRAECISYADGVCQECGRANVLQVHHPEYVEGRKPWEYSVDHCRVLCRGCHAIVHGLILPREGWVIVDNDLERGEPSDPIDCANCGREVRWHFTIYHPEWGETIVGSECAENLSLGPDVASLKSYLRRLRTFINSERWIKTPNAWKIRERDAMVWIFHEYQSFRITIDERRGETLFRDLVDAKKKVFEVLEHRRRKERSAKPQAL